jgi:hypothetical protein
MANQTFLPFFSLHVSQVSYIPRTNLALSTIIEVLVLAFSPNINRYANPSTYPSIYLSIYLSTLSHSKQPRNHPPPRHHLRQLPLQPQHPLKPHKPTRLTLKMLKQPRQRNKLLPTTRPAIRTMTNTLLKHQRIRNADSAPPL